MRNVAVTGLDGPLGRRVACLLVDAGAESVRPVGDGGDLIGALAGVDCVIDLGWVALTQCQRPAGAASSATNDVANGANLAAARRLLDAAGAAGVTALVHVSSATAYGAWADNAVPLTEQAPLRPNPGFEEGAQQAEAERLVAGWADHHPDATTAVLRPVAVMGPGLDGWLVRALGGGAPVRVRGSNPPRQFVHLDDLAAAVTLAAAKGLRGPYNVTPDGWIPGDVVGDLAAGRPPLPIPARLAGEVAEWVWRLGLSEAPPALLPLLEHPWVVANDRLRAEGWVPRYSNEEALVAGRPGSPWREMSPQRRQQVSFAVAGVTVAGAGVALGVAVRALRRRG